MAKIVNLNRARKTRDKDAAKKRADENAARFGRSKIERRIETAQADKAERSLDGHEIE
ncbi:DUF4169 family protein [Jannaschia donghaensis]|uniref:Uncharacterized protein n=1 Tax=Jannaschia donghaensis TaxID=420998 RepID=A0A0M6YP99_9RHOB|nr:DUF4169 family protein [Jannaschia donghaensis]CTQ50836.1 hypothetical protein JDO7802_02867 [Jannaschia donghaensis]